MKVQYIWLALALVLSLTLGDVSPKIHNGGEEK